MPQQTLEQAIIAESVEPFKEGKLELNLRGEEPESFDCTQSMLVISTWESRRDCLSGSTGDYLGSGMANSETDLSEMLHQNNSPNERLDQSLTGELLRSWSLNKENYEYITEDAAISTTQKNILTETVNTRRRLDTNIAVEICSHLISPMQAEGNDSCYTTGSNKSLLPHTTGMMFLGTDEIGESQLEPFSDDESDCDDDAKPKAPSSRDYIRQSITTITSPKCSPTGIDQERQLAFFWATANNRNNDFEQNDVCRGVDEPTKLTSCKRLVSFPASVLTPHKSKNEDQSEMLGRSKNRPSAAKMLSRLRLARDKGTPCATQTSRQEDQRNSQVASTAGLYQQRSNGSKGLPKVVWSYRRSQRESELPNNEGTPGSLDVYVNLHRDFNDAALEQESQFVFQDEICIDYGNGLAEC